MADIIELEKRRQQQEDEKVDTLRDEKIHLLQKVLQCSRCKLKCSRCGTQVKEGSESTHSRLPYPLCSGCRVEYEIYLKLDKGEKTSGGYWHNEEWMQMWHTWLKHQQALDHYCNSKEFLKLLREVDTLW